MKRCVIPSGAEGEVEESWHYSDISGKIGAKIPDFARDDNCFCCRSIMRLSTADHYDFTSSFSYSPRR